MASASRVVGIIVATDAKNGIAKRGAIPWRSPTDLKTFKAVTTGEGNNAVVMGRKTWESLPAKTRPLPGRVNIVLSARKGYEPEGAAVACSPREALRLAEGCAELWVIGGKETYEAFEALAVVTDLVHTRFLGDFKCDVTYEPPKDGALDRVTPLPGGDTFSYHWDR